MKKTTHFRFNDGKRVISEGDLVCIVSHNGRYENHSSAKVEKIGKKYITVNGKMFEIESGRYKSEYSHHFSLWSSCEVYVQHLKRLELRGNIVSAFTGTSTLFRYVSDDDLLEINRIISNAIELRKEELVREID